MERDVDKRETGDDFWIENSQHFFLLREYKKIPKTKKKCLKEEEEIQENSKTKRKAFEVHGKILIKICQIQFNERKLMEKGF